MKFSITDFFSWCDQIRRKLRIWSHSLKKSVMENFIFVQYLFCCLWIRFYRPQQHLQKQLSRSVLIKTCSENMQQIYRRTPIPKCDFNEVTFSIKLLCNFIEITLRYECSPVNLLHIFATSFYQNTSGELLLHELVLWKRYSEKFWKTIWKTSIF